MTINYLLLAEDFAVGCRHLAQIGRKGIHTYIHLVTLKRYTTYPISKRRRNKSGNKKENKVKEKRNNYKEIKDKINENINDKEQHEDNEEELVQQESAKLELITGNP